MLYSLLIFLIIAAVVLFLVDVSLGGGILGVIAVVVLAFILIDILRSRRARL